MVEIVDRGTDDGWTNGETDPVDGLMNIRRVR